MTPRTLAAIPLFLALAACGGTGASSSGSGKSATIRSAGQPARPAPSTRLPTRPNYATPSRPSAQVQSAPGLEGVIGADAEQLTRLFGAPRLDVREEDARKLQWSGTACILDAYLYPAAPGGRATATYVDARRGDGRDVDRAACVAALKLNPGAAPRRP